jgi:glycosyltransferase involved in cell wall biosynthesis
MTAKLTVATSFTIHPPRGGGQQRIFHLYGALARRGFVVEIVTLAVRGERAARRQLASGLTEIRIPRTAQHEWQEHALGQRAGVPAGDVALSLLHELTPAYAEAIGESARDAAAVVASHPFALPAIRGVTDLPLIYEAQDVEADLKAAMFAPGAADLVEAVTEVEAECCERAALVLACSEADAARLVERYGLDAARVALVPNGVDLSGRRFVELGDRRATKAQLGLGHVQALFIGSWHDPNVRAVRTILEAAALVPDVRFLVVGSVGMGLGRVAVPDNVDVCGVVESAFVQAVLALSDTALNPMDSGSGTNLKMLDYAAAGVPLISSRLGARGLGFEPGVHYCEAAAEPEALAAAITALAREDADTVAQRVRAARRLTEERFAWSRIARGWAEHPGMRELTAGVVA